MKNAVHGKTRESFRNIIAEKLVSNKKDYLKWASKPSYIVSSPLKLGGGGAFLVFEIWTKRGVMKKLRNRGIS